MAKNIEDLSTKLLQKKRRTAIILIRLLVIVGVLSLLALLYELIWGNANDFLMVTPAFVCIVFALFMAQDVKKIDEELSKRNNI
jgi:hypothetical protein